MVLKGMRVRTINPNDIAIKKSSDEKWYLAPHLGHIYVREPLTKTATLARHYNNHSHDLSPWNERSR